MKEGTNVQAKSINSITILKPMSNHKCITTAAWFFIVVIVTPTSEMWKC